VEVSNESGTVRQEITVTAGTTSSLVVPMQQAPQGALSGYISIAAQWTCRSTRTSGSWGAAAAIA
jgi:hypothetical protein